MFQDKKQQFCHENNASHWRLFAPQDDQDTRSVPLVPQFEYRVSMHYPKAVVRQLGLAYNNEENSYFFVSTIHTSNYQDDSSERKVIRHCDRHLAYQLIGLGGLAETCSANESRFGRDGSWHDLLIAEDNKTVLLTTWCPDNDSPAGRLCSLFESLAEDIVRDDDAQAGGQPINDAYKGEKFELDIARAKARFEAELK